MKKHFIAMLMAAAMPLALFAAETDLFKTTPWKSLKSGGAVGSVTKQEDGSYLMEKTTPEGILFLYNNGNEFPVTPGKVYRFVMEFKGDADANMMIQFPGAKRTPYPNVKAKNGVAEISIMAQSDEKSARIHLLLNSASKITVTRAFVEEIDAGDNLLLNPALNWTRSNVQGAKSTLKKSGQNYLIDAATGKGYVAFIPGVNLNITPGKHYLITITAKRMDEGVSYYAMFSMPGGKHTPFPQVKPKAAVNENETLRFVFTARDDENAVRPHVIVNGTGKVEVSSVTCRELSEEEFAKEPGAVK